MSLLKNILVEISKCIFLCCRNISSNFNISIFGLTHILMCRNSRNALFESAFHFCRNFKSFFFFLFLRYKYFATEIKIFIVPFLLQFCSVVVRDTSKPSSKKISFRTILFFFKTSFFKKRDLYKTKKRN